MTAGFAGPPEIRLARWFTGWSGEEDSHLRSSGYQPEALAAELSPGGSRGRVSIPVRAAYGAAPLPELHADLCRAARARTGVLSLQRGGLPLDDGPCRTIEMSLVVPVGFKPA